MLHKRVCEIVGVGKGRRKGSSSSPQSNSYLETAPITEFAHLLHAPGTCTFSSVAMSCIGSIISGHVDSLAHTDCMAWVADLPYVHFGILTPLGTCVCLKSPLVVLSEMSAFCTSSTRRNNNPFGICECFQFFFVWPSLDVLAPSTLFQNIRWHTALCKIPILRVIFSTIVLLQEPCKRDICAGAVGLYVEIPKAALYWCVIQSLLAKTNNSHLLCSVIYTNYH